MAKKTLKEKVLTVPGFIQDVHSSGTITSKVDA